MIRQLKSTTNKIIKEHPLLAKGAEVQQLETDPVHLLDEGIGKPTILRRFQFQLPPGVLQVNKKLLLKQHVKNLEIFLWKDELEMILAPKLVMEKNGAFSIFATCQPKKGSLISYNYKPQRIQDAINPEIHSG